MSLCTTLNYAVTLILINIHTNKTHKKNILQKNSASMNRGLVLAHHSCLGQLNLWYELSASRCLVAKENRRDSTVLFHTWALVGDSYAPKSLNFCSCLFTCNWQRLTQDYCHFASRYGLGLVWEVVLGSSNIKTLHNNIGTKSRRLPLKDTSVKVFLF